MVVGVSAVIAADVITVGLVATAVADVGLAMSLVGAVTGNQTLSKYGGELALAGGITSLGADVFGAAASTAGETTAGVTSTTADVSTGTVTDGTVSTAGSGSGSTAGQVGSGGLDGAPAPSTPGTSISGGGSSALPTPDTPVPSPDTAGVPVNGSLATQAANPPVPSAATMAGDTSIATGAPAANGGLPIDGTLAGTGANTTAQTAATAAGSGGGDTLAATSGTSGGVPDIQPGQATEPGNFLGDATQNVKDAWNKLGDTSKAEIIKAALSVPGGIQAQKNKAAELAIQQQNANIAQQNTAQHSYGSSVPVGTWGTAKPSVPVPGLINSVRS